MGGWRAAETSGKCANEGSKNLFRGGETSSIGVNMLPVKWEAIKRSISSFGCR